MAAGALTERYAANLHGVLSCFDRIIIAGTLPGACYAGGIGRGSPAGLGIMDNDILARSRPIDARHGFLTANNDIACILANADPRNSPWCWKCPRHRKRECCTGGWQTPARLPSPTLARAAWTRAMGKVPLSSPTKASVATWPSRTGRKTPFFGAGPAMSR